jgi:hypothetical protein
MSIHTSIGKIATAEPRASDWDSAIAEAEERIKGLRESIKIFRKHRDAGDKWPGVNRTTQN